MFRRFLVAIALGLWLGGFTFHALVVIPAGERVLGSVQEMGFVTQQVTVVLNRIGVVALLVALWNLWLTRPRRGLFLTWIVLAASQVGLMLLHPVLDGLLVTKTHEIADEERFYRLHQVYLWTSALQWGAGILHVALLLRRSAQPAIR